VEDALKSVDLLGIALAFSLWGCQKSETDFEQHARPIPGDIQILNSCGIPKIAGQVRAYLISRGFDVVEVGNDSHWNYEETIIALRDPHWPGAKALAAALGTTNVIPLENPLKMVHATVYIGKDIQKVIDHDRIDKKKKNW